MAANVAAQVPTLELKTTIHADEHSHPQELNFGDDREAADGLLLHLIRTIALYMFVLLSQTAKLVVIDAELAVFASDATTPDLLDAQTAELQRRLHAALFAWVESEVNCNQFDGLLQEQRAFVVIKRLFRQQHTKAAAQCRVLSALLSSYLTRLETPLVHCDSTSMLSSTLEYLLARERNVDSKEAVPLSMLYPLVNAVDLVSIEQRECLDALMNLLRWLSLHDYSQSVFTAFTSKFYDKIIGLTGDGHDSHNDDSKRMALSVCFVQMLLRYSDHIFRRDLQFEDMVPTFSYSDTEDDDFSSEDGSAHSRPQSFHDLNDIPDNLSAADFEKLTDANSTNNTLKHEDTTIEPPPELQESSKKDNILVKEAVDVANKDVTLPPTKMTSRSLRKRKKREEKVTAPPAETTRRTNKSRSKSVCVPDLVNDAVLSQEYELEEPLPALVCITIAAAAGTLAAVLCVFYN